MSTTGNQTPTHIPLQRLEEGYYLLCPHCQFNIFILYTDVNCGIFRCGVFKTSGESIPPHISEDQSNSLIAQNMIIGCGKPFQIKDGQLSTCGWI